MTNGGLDELAAARAKTERNKRVQARYDQLMASGAHGHYETLFRVVREEVERETACLRTDVSALKAAVRVHEQVAKVREQGFAKVRAELAEAQART